MLEYAGRLFDGAAERAGGSYDLFPFEELRLPFDGEFDSRLLLRAGAFEREFPAGVRLFEEPAQGGRSACAEGADWLAPLGRLGDPLPNPCGARPRSVAFPCADQFLDPVFAGRFAEAPLFTDARPLTAALADGGRLLASSRCRADREPELAEGEFPAPRAPNLVVLPTRPAESARVSIVRTGMCDAAAAGAVRATTERLDTDAGGVATRPRAFAAPV